MNATLLLSIATLALVVGPLLERLGRRVPLLTALVDGATLGGIAVVALLHLLPEAGVHLGAGALLAFGAGLALPVLAERLLERRHQGLRASVGALIVVLVVVHEVIEGAALASTANDERLALATLLVIVGHRLPLGVLIWGEARRLYGAMWSALVLALVAAVAFFGPLLVPVQEEGVFAGILAGLLAGGLLHLVLQHPPLRAHVHGSPSPGAARAWSGFGALAAAGFFLVFLREPGELSGHLHEGPHVAERLGELILEVSVPLLVGLLGAALIEAFLPPGAVRWIGRGGRARQAAAGVLVGAPMPVCSCGVLPVYRSLVAKGAPPAAALSLLVAAPEIGIDSVLLSWPLLGPETTIARVACALLLALGVGWIVSRFAGAPAAAAAPAASGPRERPLVAMRRGLLETWSHLAPWILIGLAATALVEPWIDTSWARAIPPAGQVAVLALAGMPTYICASAATPFAALLLAKGFSAGAVIAFLLTGPATNLTTFGVLAKLHSRRLAVAFVATALALTLALGLLVDLALPPAALQVPAPGAESAGPLDMAAAVVLGLLTAWLVLREGPRRFLGRFAPGGGAQEPVEGPAGAACAHGEHPRAGEARA